MHQPGLFDLQTRIEQVNECGNPLVKLDEAVDWEAFRPTLETIHHKERKNGSGRKPYDVVLMFKVLVLQSLYNLSDRQVEVQVKDRLSFMAFLGLRLGESVPDEKTVWLFRERLGRAGLVETLFAQFDADLAAAGFAARKGQIVDASIVPAPRQRNTREENADVKNGTTPQAWEDDEAKKRQKDVDARWTKKRGVWHYGYKNHVSVDVEHKFVRNYVVTDASVHDSQVLGDVLDPANSSGDVYGDSAYRSEAGTRQMEDDGYRDRTHRRAHRNKPLTKRQVEANRKKSRIRSRVEHVFGVQSQMAGRTIVRTIGIVRARVKIGLRNLAYNIRRYAVLVATG